MTSTRIDYMAHMAVTGLPPARSGDVEVRQFTVDKHAADLERMRAAFYPGGRYVPEGTYTSLYRSGILYMSDTPDERSDCLGFIYRCEKRQAHSVLVNGLGLGSIIGGLVRVPSITSISICEIDPDVIALVGDHVIRLGAEQGVVVEISQGDAFTPAETWAGRPQRWDAAWHDIWPTICADDYEEHKRMRRLYGRRVGYQEVWAGQQVRDLARRERSGRVYGGVWF